MKIRNLKKQWQTPKPIITPDDNNDKVKQLSDDFIQLTNDYDKNNRLIN